MSTIDSRVVEMNFDNSKFGSGVSSTLSMLDRLKSALHLGGASKGLQDINAAAQNFNGAPMEQGVGRIAGAFSSMQAVAFGALANIGAKISSVAMNMASAFTLDPIKAGFDEYELKMGSIQTILANTQRHGTGLETINTEFEKLNDYADQTIYNFGDMTRNVGLFTAAGIKVEDATTMIKGFSNAAATTGTSAEKAAGAAYQLSQSLGDGKITLETWNSLSNAGMGNKNMQDSLVQLADKMGTFAGTGVTATDAAKGFNKSLEKGWLAPEVMSEYLKIMSGDMDDAAIAALGFTDAEVAAFRAQANMGIDSATKVRTFTALMSTLKEAVGSGWSESFALIFGDFNEATDLFTNMNNAIGGFLGRSADARNELLKGWKDAGGRTALIEGLKEGFWALAAPIAQIGQAFRDVFPKMTADRLVEITNGFRDLMIEIQPSPETLDRLQRTFAGLFAILHIGWTVIKAVAEFLGKLFLGVTEGDQGILRITASIGDFFVGLDKALSSGQGLNSFFDKLLDLVFKIINPIRDAGQAIGKMFEGVGDLSVIGGQIGELISKFLSFGHSTDEAGGKATGFMDTLKGVFSTIGNMARSIANFISPVTDAIADALQSLDFDKVMDALQTLSLGGIAIFIKQLGGMFKGLELFKGAGGGIMDKIKQGLDGVTGTLSAMQANLKASMLLKIAGAIALLAVSVVLLASVDSQGLMRATAALTAMFVQLGAAMYAFQKIGTIASIAKLNLMGGALILIAAAILILTAAVKVLSDLSWEELAKGLGALVIMMAVLVGASQGMDKSRGAVLRSAAALVIFAFAMKQLVDVVKELGAMDLSTMGKGLLGVGALLIGLAIFTKIQGASKGSVASAAGLLLLAIALKILADVVGIFSEMTWEEMIKGFAGVAGGLIAMAIALKFFPKGPQMILVALTIGKVAGALGLMALAFKQFNEISWEVIARGLVALGGAMTILVIALKKMPKVGLPQTAGLVLLAVAIKILVSALVEIGQMDIASLGVSIGALAAILLILVVAMKFMQGSLTGAAAMLVIAAALNVLIPVLLALGNTPISVLIIGLTALAAVFIILGLAAWALAPVTPVLLSLGIAIGLLGLALALAGAGVFLFATGLSILAVAGAGATASIVAIVSGLIGLIPMVIEQIGIGIVAFAQVIANAGPAILGAITAVLLAFLQAIIDVTPKVAETFMVLLTTLLTVLIAAVPMLVEAGFRILIGFLDGIARNIGRVVDSATDIVVNFLNGISRNLGRIIQAGIDLIISFVNGIADGIRKNSDAMSDAGINLAKAIVEGMVKGIGKGITAVVDAAKNLAKGALNAAKDFLGINSPSKAFTDIGMGIDEGMVKGIDKYSGTVVNATENMGRDALNGMKKTISGLGDLIAAEGDMTPVIAPVLDLTNVRRDAAGIGALLTAQPLDVGSSYSGAASASAGYRSNQADSEDVQYDQNGESLMFIQNNYSPKAISAAETYRNTKSQLSVAKEALKTNAN